MKGKEGSLSLTHVPIYYSLLLTYRRRDKLHPVREREKEEKNTRGEYHLPYEKRESKGPGACVDFVGALIAHLVC